MFNLKPTELDERLTRERIAYIVTVALLTMALLIFYILKYNIEYKIYSFNTFFAFSLFILLAVAPTLYYLTKKLYYSFLIYYSMSCILGCFLIYTAGGIRAPGTFWLSTIPLFGGVAIGRKGAVLGSVFTFLALIYFYYGEFTGGIHTQLDLSTEFYLKEKIINLSVFFLTSVFVTIYFLVKQERAQEEIKAEKEMNENLLRILFHDLATPIQILQLKLKKISRLNNIETIEVEINKMDNAIQKLYEQLDNVRKMKAIKDGKVNLNIVPTPLVEIISNSVEQLQTKTQQKEISVVVKNTEDLEQHVFVDQILFNCHILNNILANAIKFSDRKSEIHIFWSVQGQNVCIDIQDFGIGMPPHVVKELFNEKSNVSRKGTEGEAGTGYGMSIVKSCLVYFNGRIEVTSVEKDGISKNHGTTFRIILPTTRKN